MRRVGHSKQRRLHAEVEAFVEAVQREDHAEASQRLLNLRWLCETELKAIKPPPEASGETSEDSE